MSTVKNIFTTPIQEFVWNRSDESLNLVKEDLFNKKPIGEEFMNWILECANNYSNSIGKRQGYLVCRDVWHRTMTEPYSYVPPHHHPSTWAVGTFYFEEGQGDLVLFDPRGSINEWEWKEIKDIDGRPHSSCTDFYYQPKKNTAIFFPGYLKHMVLPSNRKRYRTAISWNIAFEESFEAIKLFNVPDHQWRKISYEM